MKTLFTYRKEFFVLGILLLFYVMGNGSDHVPILLTETELVVASGPPSSGNWEITEDTTIDGQSFILNGSIIVESGGRLLLNNSVILLNSPSTDTYRIIVRSGGTLEIAFSTIESYTGFDWFMEADSGSELIIRNESLLKATDESMRSLVKIQCDYASITNSSFENSNFDLIFIDNASHAYISGNEFIDAGRYGILGQNAFNTTVVENEFVNSGMIGIYLDASSQYSNIIGNRLTKTGNMGIMVRSDNVSTSFNVLQNIGVHGIYYDNSDHSNITGNVMKNVNVHGIAIRGATSNHLIQGNFINNTQQTGIFVGFSTNIGQMENVSMVGNVVENAEVGALKLQRCINSEIYLNAFSNKTPPSAMVDSFSSNINWDNGTYGNYWSDYNGTDMDLDGIGDQVWNITADKTHQDNYPLMNDSLPWQMLADIVYAPPRIVSLIQDPEEVSPVSKVNFRAIVQSDHGLKQVLFGWAAAPAEISSWYEMNKVGNEWNYTIPAHDFGTEIKYALRCESRTGQWEETDIESYIVSADQDPPVISSIETNPESPTHIDDVIITAVITDDIYVHTAVLSYSVDSGDWNNLTMTGDDDTYSQSIPAQQADSTVHYRIMANDSFDNWASSSEFFYVVDLYDVDGPLIDISIEPNEPTEEDDVIVSVLASDPSGVENVTIAYKVESDGTWANITTTKDNDIYTGIIPAQDPHSEVFYKAFAVDSKRNWNTSQEYSYIVQYADQEGPEVVSWYVVPSNPVYNDSVWVYVNISDPSGVVVAFLDWSTDGGTSWFGNITMEELDNGLWRSGVPLFDPDTVVHIKIWSRDYLQNWGVEVIGFFTIGQATTDTTTPDTTTPEDGFDTGMLLIIGGIGIAAVVLVMVALKKSRR